MVYYKIIRRRFTLIEILIALSLTVGIMSALSYFFLQIQEINIKTENSLRDIYQLAYLENRLSDVIPQAISETDSKRDFVFYTTTNAGTEFIQQGSPNLIFTYNNGTDLNKKFSNHVLGRLFLDQENRLVLATMPSYIRWKEGTIPEMKQEVLLEGVTGLSFSFFIPRAVDRTKIVEYESYVLNKKISAPEPRESWIDDWKFEYYELPALVKIHLRYNTSTATNKELTFTFPLPNSTNTLIYTE